MGVLSTRVLDGSVREAYNASVAGSTAPRQHAPTPATPGGRRRRRPPSLSEQRNRSERIAPWTDLWKQLKANGRWR